MSRRRKQRESPRNDGTQRARTVIYSIAALLCIVGLGEATYLTVAHLTGETVTCGGSTGCNDVLGSKYASIGPVPLAGFGALAYFTAFSCAVLAAFGYARAGRFFGWTVGAMFAATLWLLVVQAFLLHSFCRYCLFSAALVFVLTAAAIAMPPARSG